MISEICFTLENTSQELDAMAVLIPAMLRRNGLLHGCFLALGEFKDADDKGIVLIASEESPKRAIAELDEYAAQLQNIKVIAVTLETDDFSQATLNCVEKVYQQFKDAVVKNIPTVATLEPGKNAVVHTFNTPFLSGPMKSLEMKVLKGKKVKIKLTVELPILADDKSADAAQSGSVHPVTV